jgi:GDP-mannose 6-dehydrogenase
VGKGYKLIICDENVHVSKLVGANKQFIEERIPHLSDLITNDVGHAIQSADVVLINHNNFNPEPHLEILKKKAMVIDLVRITQLEKLPNYVGLCW